MNRRHEVKPVVAVAYARVSSKEQDKEGYSIPAQQKLIRGYAAEKGITILREFVDVETARKAGRTHFGEMLGYLRKNPTCRVVLVEKTDRLYRNIKDWVTIDEMDLEIHFVKEATVLSRDSRSSEKFVHGIKVLMAKNYVDNLSEETRKGLNHKAEEGIPPGWFPLGYRVTPGVEGRKGIEPDPEYAPLVRRLFEWYATGHYSLDQLAELAKEAGFTSPKSSKALSRAGLHLLLTKRIYTGRFDYKGRTYQGKYEPLVSEDLWARVQSLLRERGKKKPRFVKHDFAFSRLITCGHCGCALVGEIKKGRYVYYHCTGYKGKCPEPFTREEVLEERFTDVLRRLVIDEEVVELVREALRRSHQDVRAEHERAVARLQAEYTKLQTRIDAMYVDKLDGVIDGAFFDRKATDWRDAQQAILRDIATHQQANATYLEEGVHLLDLTRRLPELFSGQVPREKRRLLDFVLSNCTWAGGELTVQFRQPFDLLALGADESRTEKAVGGSPDGLRLEKLGIMDSNHD